MRTYTITVNGKKVDEWQDDDREAVVRDTMNAMILNRGEYRLFENDTDITPSDKDVSNYMNR